MVNKTEKNGWDYESACDRIFLNIAAELHRVILGHHHYGNPERQWEMNQHHRAWFGVNRQVLNRETVLAGYVVERKGGEEDILSADNIWESRFEDRNNGYHVLVRRLGFMNQRQV